MVFSLDNFRRAFRRAFRRDRTKEKDRDLDRDNIIAKDNQDVRVNDEDFHKISNNDFR